MSAQHTPGPWTARRWTCHAATTVTVEDATVVTGRRTIADCESEEDARLIAAAPDLLEALQEVRAAQRFSDRPPKTVEEAESKLDRIRKAAAQADAAIAKATSQEDRCTTTPKVME